DVVQRISGEDLNVQFDATAVKPGERVRIPINVIPPARYKDRVKLQWSPKAFIFVSDAARQLPISVKPVAQPEGWELRGPPRSEPEQATVTGSEESVDRVAAVVAPFTPDPQERISVMVTLQAIDAANNNITGVRVEP